MFNPLTQINYFFKRAREQRISGSEQLMWLHIFNAFNKAHRSESLRIEDAALKEKGFIEVVTGDELLPENYWQCQADCVNR